MKRIFILFIRTYQYLLSPLLGNRCRFYPSCSSYALEAFETFGVWHAVWLTGKRLLRCHPFCAGGVDPLPEPNRKHG